MNRLLPLAIALLALGCGGDAACELPAQWSTARPGDGSTCQVNLFGATEHAAYCGGTPGNWSCACGPAAENPRTFVSEDLCELDGDARVCQAIARCGW